MSRCAICAESNVGPEHEITKTHIKNKVLHEYAINRKKIAGNRKGIAVSCNVRSSSGAIVDYTEAKIKISAQPQEEITFKFTVMNETKKENIAIIFIQMTHNMLNFTMNRHGLEFGCNPVTLSPKQVLSKEITVTFKSANVGQYQMPIIFSFRKPATNEGILIVRDMVVYVEDQQQQHEKIVSPYTKKEVFAKTLMRTTIIDRNEDMFRIPKNLKPIYGNALKVKKSASDSEKELCEEVMEIFKTGITPDNYVKFFHHLLWYEETVVRINLKNYNMTNVPLLPQGRSYALVIPGLSEKRPSVMIGDVIFVRPHDNEEVMFEAVVGEIAGDNVVNLKGFHRDFSQYQGFNATFDIRFFMSRLPLERMHLAVQNIVHGHPDQARVFPKPNPKIPKIKPLENYFNPCVEENPEQRCAVEHIVAGSSGVAPYLLHGPPGTGKTVTIVEAILQLVLRNPRNRILVCTDSNMAADHVASLLINFSPMFDEKTFLFRANSKFRVWETLPLCLAKFSNGYSRESFVSVRVSDLIKYSIVVTTLSHAAKFAKEARLKKMQRPMSHVFIDEAAQASEPASLIPVTGLLASKGHLVLAGDPLQLGPVIISRHADKLGLGLSLMARLKNTCSLYAEPNDPNYTLMLKNNFRSDGDILDIPNEKFYNGELRYKASPDPLSRMGILTSIPNSRAIIFHGVLSAEQKMGKSPSFYNSMELEIVKQYVRALITKHRVRQDDIGVVTPYIRQVYKVKQWLQDQNLNSIEVGTVEAFQGKEKRVIIISCVRANANLLAYDAKFQLGFLVDDKRFNVALTRAKAKAIIIGNPLCLEKDVKWRTYMEKCRTFGTYCGYDPHQQNVNEARNNAADRITPMLKDLKINKAQV